MTGERRKPPLGLRPRSIVVRERTLEVLAAVVRYAEEGLRVPQEWRDELEDLLDDTPVWEEVPAKK